MKKFRIEVTFSSGKFIAFPDVVKDSVHVTEEWMTFKHGSRKDFVNIRLNSVDFIEQMEIDE